MHTRGDNLAEGQLPESRIEAMVRNMENVIWVIAFQLSQLLTSLVKIATGTVPEMFAPAVQ